MVFRGPGPAVAEFVRVLRGEGVLCQVPPSSGPASTPWSLEPFLAPIRQAADGFPAPSAHRAGVVRDDRGTLPWDEAAVRELFVRHLLEPVRFRELTEWPCTPATASSCRPAPAGCPC